jgi:hypothetical protein
VDGFPRQDCSTHLDIAYAAGLLSSVRNMAEGKLVKTFRWPMVLMKVVVAAVLASVPAKPLVEGS